MSFLEDSTMGLIGKSPQYGKEAARAEARRQAIIKSGVNQVNAVFGGGQVPVYSVVSDPISRADWKGGAKNNAYWTVNKKGEFVPYYMPNPPEAPNQLLEGTKAGALALVAPWEPMNFTMGLFGKGPPTQNELVNRAIRNGQLFTRADETYTGFGPDFYTNRAKAYEAFQRPYLAEQYRDTSRAMRYGQTNRGLTGSTVAREQGSRLNRRMRDAGNQITDTGRSQAQELERDVQNQKQLILDRLYQSADPGEARAAALRAYADFKQPQAFTPIANMFGDLANTYYLNQLYNQYRPGAGTEIPDYYSGLAPIPTP